MQQSVRQAPVQREFHFMSSSIIHQISRGILVGVVVGIVVGLFRLFIEVGLEHIVELYQNGGIVWILIAYVIYVLLSAHLIKSEKNIKGSGIPQVEAELKGLMSQNWWSILWKKFVAGTLAISSGLMLGREGPSIQLGALLGKGIANMRRLTPVEERTLIASGAAAGLAAAFNAPIAGLLFVVEEVHRHFSRFVWVTTLTASLVANFISLNMFGLKPVLDMPDYIVHMDLHQYWLFLVLGILLGIAGYLYVRVVLWIPTAYQWLAKYVLLPSHYHSVIAFMCILPIGIYLPRLLGGGNNFIINLPHMQASWLVLIGFFLIRFVWSMISYGSGLPGGIFLPILVLGSLLGAIVGQISLSAHLISESQFPIFIILGMSGYFGAISKAPLTAIILVTEMVGDIRNLMALGIVTLVAYSVSDLLKGVPVYEAMLEKLLPETITDSGEMTLIEIPVSENIANQPVYALDLPSDVLITTCVHNGKTQVVSGNTQLYVGDTIYIVLKKSDIGKVKDMLL